MSSGLVLGLLSMAPAYTSLPCGSITYRCGVARAPEALPMVAMAWEMQHISGTGASLMLTLEAMFTALLARWLYQETMDRRVRCAMLLLLAGDVALVVDQAKPAATSYGVCWPCCWPPPLGARTTRFPARWPNETPARWFWARPC